MHKIMVVHESEEMYHNLKKEMGKPYHFSFCSDPVEAIQKIKEIRPHGLLLDAELPGMDGLTLLEQISEYRPPVILMLITEPSGYVIQSASNLGVGYVMRKPCSLLSLHNRLQDMIRQMDIPQPPSPKKLLYAHLIRLSFDPSDNRLHKLLLALLFFAQDPQQRVTKELYPAVGAHCGCSWESVEIDLRKLIQETWARGDREIWNQYFPNQTKAPTTKHFLSALINFLQF